MDKMRMESVDVRKKNIEKIAELFPGVITEKLDEIKSTSEEKVYKKAINFDILRQLLSEEEIAGDEAYEFTWVGKRAAMIEANTPIRKTLRPCKEESRDWDTTENLYIEGDNLEVLKLLQESYLGQVKMIYIDPPYNTGNDFLYNDSFEINSKNYDMLTEYYDDENMIQFKKNDKNNPRYHSAWCSMMYTRLSVASMLLKDEGTIFISIDDNEVHDLRKICDEIFGEANFIGCAGRISKKANNQGDYWAPNFDYLLTYAKNKLKCPAFFGGINYSSYNLVEEEGERKGEKYQLVRLYMTSLDPMRGCNNQRYYIECPDGTFIIPPGENFPEIVKDGSNIPPQSGKDKVWRWSYNSYLEKKDSIVVKKGKSSNVVGVNGEATLWNAFTKTYLNDVISKSSATPNSFIEEHINQNASHELKKLGIPFDFAKPTSLIKYLAEVCKVDNNDIVLDFFSGSASTADAVIQYNISASNKAKFIVVQLPEKCNEDTDAYKEGFENICEIGKERIRRAGDKILSENPEVKDLDIGFRVFKVDESNMKDVYYAAGDYNQNLLDLMESNIKEDRNDLDLLFSCILEWGMPLSLPYSKEYIDGITIHNVADGDLIACFEENVSEEVIRKIAQKDPKPLRVVFRDSSFMNSPAKINVEEIFKLLSPNTKIKVL